MHGEHDAPQRVHNAHQEVRSDPGFIEPNLQCRTSRSHTNASSSGHPTHRRVDHRRARLYCVHDDPTR